MIEEGDWTSNQLWIISESTRVKDFLERNCVYVQWTEEDRRLLADGLNIGPRWKLLVKRWENRSAGQLKNRWDSVLRHRVQGHLNDHQTIARILDQGCRRLPIPQRSVA
jgi:hypothetical protein